MFTACRDNGTAVEINSRPERRDPPTRLLNLAMEIGCVFSIDTDSHAPGQLEFLGYGAQRALDAGCAGRPDRQHLAGRQAAGVDDVLIQSGSMRHLQAGIAADQHAAGQRGVAVALPHPVDRSVDRDVVSTCSVERQLQLLGAVAVDVGHREPDQRQAALGDQRRGRRDQAARRVEDRVGRRGCPGHRVRPGGPAEVVEPQPQHHRSPGAVRPCASAW